MHFLTLFVFLALSLTTGSSKAQEPRTVRISQATGGFGGQLKGTLFGTSVEVLGDLDGDGTLDLAVGAPGDNANGANSGAVWILFLNPDATVKGWQKITMGEGGFDGQVGPADRFGFSLATVGDLDGDGNPELVVAAPNQRTVLSELTIGSPDGFLTVLFLGPDGSVLKHTRLKPLGAIEGHISSIGDLNHDGTQDLLVQGLGDRPDGHGRVSILRLQKDGSQLGSLIPIGVNPSEDFVGLCEAASDLNRDTIQDVACGGAVLIDDPGGTAPFVEDALAIIHLLGNDGRTRRSATFDLRLWGIDYVAEKWRNENGPYFAASMARSETLSGLIVGAPTANGNTGAVVRAFFNTRPELVTVQRLTEVIRGGSDSGEADFLGRSVAVGDLDGNGLEEIFVGAPRDNDGGTQRGAVRVLFNPPLPAPAVASAEAAALAAVDQDVHLECRIFDLRGVDEARLNFRRGGDPNFFSGDMTAVDDTTFVFDIPGFVAGRRGIEYYVTASNIDGADTRWPASGSVSIPVRLPDGVSFAAPAGTEVSGYRLITFPLDLDSDDAAAVLEDDLGPYDVKRWRFFQWLPALKPVGPRETPPSLGTLVEYGTRPITIRPGTSYWLLVKDVGRRVGSGPGATVPTAEPFVLPTGYGYHFVANPFAFDLPIGQVMSSSERIVRTASDLESLGLIEMLSFTEGEFIPTGDTLKAFGGYALYVGECYDTDFLLCSENTTGALHFYANREAVPAPVSKAVPHAAPDWAIRIAAVQGQARDRFNYAAVSSSASADWDPLDRPEPPVIGNYVSVSFPHPEWQRPAARFRQDTRPVPEEGDIWDFEVGSRNTTPVRLTFDGVDSVPPRLEIWLVDAVAGIRQNLRDDSDYRLAGPGEAHPARLTLVVGTAEFAAGRFANTRPVPARAALLPVYPNPFSGSATVRYVLAEESSVSLEVIDVLGRRVRSLLEGRVQPAGYHALVWDGRHGSGAELAAGFYFLRLRTGGRVQNRSVVLVR